MQPGLHGVARLAAPTAHVPIASSSPVARIQGSKSLSLRRGREVPLLDTSRIAAMQQEPGSGSASATLPSANDRAYKVQGVGSGDLALPMPTSFCRQGALPVVAWFGPVPGADRACWRLPLHVLCTVLRLDVAQGSTCLYVIESIGDVLMYAARFRLRMH
jgi:hypothetical protein